jgi:uncharacterized protein (TIGR03546 family)
MIIWTIKLLNNVRKAVAGRNHPNQLAWAVAFGLVLGLIPHGNLIALVWLLVVLTLNINHSMAAITAIGSSFVAGRLDPYSHQVGEYFLNQPTFHSALVTAWQWPLVAWTDLNNTVVLGSFSIALVAMLPTFVVTYPIFRYFGRHARKVDTVASEASTEQKSASHSATVNGPHKVVVIDQAHKQVARPHRSPIEETREQDACLTTADFTPVADSYAATDGESNVASSKREPHVAVETRIDVIRIADYREPAKGVTSDSSNTDDNEPMDEAFRYLLHQLRDSQQRKAA